MTQINTTREELTAVVQQVVEKVIDRHLRIMYANARRSFQTSPRLSSVGFLVGLNEICGFLHCSRPTALKQMETTLKPAVLTGKDRKRYMLDGDLALQLLQKNAERHPQALQHPQNSKNENHD